MAIVWEWLGNSLGGWEWFKNGWEWFEKCWELFENGLRKVLEMFRNGLGMIWQ